jgi:DNA mismatch repair protein MutS
MFKEYINLYQTYSQKYGTKTAIFMMVGSFYELYDIQNKETGETQANVREIVDYLGIQMSSKKDGDIKENEEGLFAGFPDYVMHKWAGRLTTNGYTVILVDQIKDMRGKVKERKVSRILSPSTHIENTLSNETPYVMTVFFQVSATSAPSFGAGILDLTTGSTKTYSGQAQGRTDVWTVDDLVQMISVYSPKEINIHWKSATTAMPEETFFRRILGTSSSTILHLRLVESLGAFASDIMRVEYLQKTYTIRSMLPPRTYLGLRTDMEEYALLYLLQFVEEHYPSMLQSFQRNEPWIPHARLICGNHALTQLQMTNATTPSESVIGLFDKAITPMGKRAIKERLLSPYSQPAHICEKLNELKEYMTWPEEKSKQLERQLRFMYDLPRLHRKMLCGLITASEIAQLFQTYGSMDNIMMYITKDSILQEPITQKQWDNYQDVLRSQLSEEKALRASADTSALNDNAYPEIAKKEEEIQEILQRFQQIRRDMARLGEVQDDAIRLEEREKEPFGLKGSTITLQQLKKNSSKLLEGTKINELKSGGWIDCNALQQANTKLVKARESLEHLIRMVWVDMCMKIVEAGQDIWHSMEHWVSHIDTTQCMGRVSKELGFTCPVIEDNQSSFVEIQQMRHPLVEATSGRMKYVKHNVSLGKSSNGNSSKGWLLYGLNAGGKSTLMKATGICVLLAQAGCFVPAQHMKLCPFTAVYTRILNQDNLFAGLSSFATEMSELRDILRNANSTTLVLGDELCSGTESISAQALVASGIQWLSQRNAKFIFATHLHDLPKHIDVQKEGVEVWHLHVEYDPVSQKLIYDRSLRPGSGSTLYGLEVARAMDLPFEFIEQALQNRHKIMGTTTQENAKASTWNTAVVRKECEICKKNIPKDLEVHHVKERHTASHSILPDGTHMNHASNLMVICQECHDQIHAGNIEVGDIQLTSNGPERVIHMNHVVEPGKAKKGKWSEDELETITKTLKTYTSLSLKVMKGLLQSKHEIDISEGVLSKMRKEL